MDFVAKYRKKKNENSPSKDTQNNKQMVFPFRGFEFFDSRPQSPPASLKGSIRYVQTASQLLKRRLRALSAPSELSIPDQIGVASAEFNKQETSNSKGNIVKDSRTSEPLPLPLPLPFPSPDGTKVPKSLESLRSRYASVAISISGPLPLPAINCEGLRNFSFLELSSACQNFSVERHISKCKSHSVYEATFLDDMRSLKKTEATINRLWPSYQCHREFINEVTQLASLEHPNLCRLKGFHVQENSDEHLVVYERLHYGSLDQLLQGKSDCPNIDWLGRMKVALCAAKGLVFLHDEGPSQAMYQEFSAAKIQVDKDFTAKLSGYGCVNHNPYTYILNHSMVTAYLSPETLEKGLLTPKSNVYSFGVMLLELMTGRKHMDKRYSLEERNIVKWSRHFLSDDCRLLLIIDSRIKGRCSPKAARVVADIALKCLQKEPSERPTMRDIVEALKNVQDMKYPSGHPLQQPSVVTGKQMLTCPSLTGINLSSNVMNFSRSPLSPILSPAASVTSIPMPTN